MSNIRIKCCFLLFDGFSNMVLANALEPLRAARNLPAGPEISWVIATTVGASAMSSSGISVSANVDINALEDLDFLFVVSGYGVHDHIDASTLAKLQRLRHKTQNIVGLDAGAWLMAEAGFLDGHEATIHWQELDPFREAFPNVTVQHRNFVFSETMITCGGASAAFDTVLEIIRQQFGDKVAFDVSNLFVFDIDQTLRGQPTRAAGSGTLRAAVRAMWANTEAPISLADLAKSSGVSLSTLNREFQIELKCSPGAYYRGIRLDYAHRLALETRLPNVDLAQRSGFGSAASLCRAFLSKFGKTISETRRAVSLDRLDAPAFSEE